MTPVIKEGVGGCTDWSALEAAVLQQLEHTEHDWDRDEQGELLSVWSSTNRQHFGPVCRCCGYAPCLRCVGRDDTCVTLQSTCGC